MQGNIIVPVVYNTLTRRKEKINPRDAGKIGMYVCGPTVYDYSHIGHARAYVFFDVFFRLLRWLGFEVTYVRNITDIDDKLIKKANEEKISVEELAAKYTEAFHEDMEKLGNLSPTIEPKATMHIEQMQEMISLLIKKNIAYQLDGDVYFSVDAFPDYGKLSRRSMEARVAGARVEADLRLKNPADFALWKAAKQGEPFWNSPWGAGRPGWHIECSAMSLKYLGNDFDIHGGGMDLIFPHHENEIAQAEGATGKPFCRMFVHNGFVNVNREKMSKSLGNFFLIREVLKNVDAESLRLFLLGTHYRSPIDLIVEKKSEKEDLSFPQIQDAQKRILYFYESICKIEEIIAAGPQTSEYQKIPVSEEIAKKLTRFKSQITDALTDDINTAEAIGYVNDFFRFVNDTMDSCRKAKDEVRKTIALLFKEYVSEISFLMGICTKKAGIFIEEAKSIHLQKKGISKSYIESKIEERQNARKRKDYQKSDSIRKELEKLDIELMDTPAGTKWRIKI